MKNGDKPINPVLTQSPSLQNDTSLGLTKREHYAGTKPKRQRINLSILN